MAFVTVENVKCMKWVKVNESGNTKKYSGIAHIMLFFTFFSRDIHWRFDAEATDTARVQKVICRNSKGREMCYDVLHSTFVSSIIAHLFSDMLCKYVWLYRFWNMKINYFLATILWSCVIQLSTYLVYVSECVFTFA